MADEEEGFTFVDKRKTVVGDPADEPVGSASADDAQRYESSEASEVVDNDTTPTTAMLLQYCAKLLAADAWQKMGLLPDPRTGQAAVDLTQAKLAIDAVADLIGKIGTVPETEVSRSEQRELKNLLNDLRLNYVNQRSGTPIG